MNPASISGIMQGTGLPEDATNWPPEKIEAEARKTLLKLESVRDWYLSRRPVLEDAQKFYLQQLMKRYDRRIKKLEELRAQVRGT